MQRRRIRSYSWLGGLALLGASEGALAQTPPADAPTRPDAPAEPPASDAPRDPSPDAPAAEAAAAAPEPPAAPEPAPAAGVTPSETPAETAPAAAPAAPVERAAPPGAAAGPPLVEPSPAEPTAPASPGWGDQAAEPSDAGVEQRPSDESHLPAKPSRWRATRLAFEQSLSTQTLGVGEDYQSANPTYDWTLWFRPRYYFIDKADWTYSVRAIFSIGQELTDNDTTTRMREIDAGVNDAILQLRYDRTLYERDASMTRIGVGLPELTLPTSKASRNNGRILGVGAGLIPSQVLPLMQGAWLPSFSISGLARYQHYITRAQVPTSSDIEQQRTDLDGRPVVSDQLSASPFAKHETRFGFGTELAIHDKIIWASDFQWRPTWNYEVDDDAEICGLLTGCTEVDGIEAPETYEVVTVFASEIEAYAFDSVSFTVGYINIANQLGTDGQRRSMFYSPDARFYFAVNFYPSEVLDPGQAPKHVAKAHEARPLTAF